MRLLVCGDRNWSDSAFLYHILDEAHEIAPISWIIEGEAPGADIMAREWAAQRGVNVMPFPADWDRYQRAAGPIRNRQMAREGKPDYCFAFHNNIRQSKGTADMLYCCGVADIPWELFPQGQRTDGLKFQPYSTLNI